MSVLEVAIDELSNQHNVRNGIDSIYKVNWEEGECPLTSGIEYSFVGLFCQEILQRTIQLNLPSYNHIFFIPNLRAESKVGYDLSIGFYEQDRRVRSMHKVINKKWCDRRWTYRINYSQNEKGDYGHLNKLLNPFQPDPELPEVQIFPYLVINICYYIHDYRRMGALFRDWNLPSFDSLLKTIIFDLHSLQDQLDILRIPLNSNDFYLRISRVPEKINPGEAQGDYIARIANKDNIRIECSGHIIESQDVILSFDEFLQQRTLADLLNTQPQ